ncbi:MAG: hypothetical protein DMG81_03985 [Acidobacteria bacterium]|nr:MAG: hypothetical protein DMG81_03985 [Acidobacteriota bacterium]
MHGRYAIALALYSLLPLGLRGQTAAILHVDPPPQTARQALLEMFFGLSPAQFLKHLPTDAQVLVKKNVNVLPLQEFSQTLGQLQMPGRKIETFDTGPILVRSEDPYAQRTIEVAVDSEYEGVDEDEIHLSPHVYHSGKLHSLPVVPKITCTMEFEAGVWRLSDIAVDLHVPIGDRTFLDALGSRLRPEGVETIETAALGRLRTLSTAEVSYTASFPEVGFTCSLADLGGSGQDEPTPNAAMLIDAGLASGKLDGYVFSLEDCTGSPVDHFQILAIPENTGTEMRAFCSDESANIRYSENGDAGACLSAGEPLAN